jgi:UDP-N-acetylmuramate dehydrogenase
MKILERPSLSQRTTLKMGGVGLAELLVKDEADWDQALRFIEREGGSPFVLGRGSNVLAEDGLLPLVLIRLQREEPRVVRQDKNTAVIQVGAGFSMPGLLGWLARNGLSGLEPLTGIPGSVGGAAAMNAGSYGQTIGACLTRIQVVSQRQGLRWLERDMVKLGYRHFDPGLDEPIWLITRAELELRPASPEEIRTEMRSVYTTKKSTQPITSRTCGCVFKNPGSDHPAGRILDQCGLKGRRAGQVGFSELHANFLINYGQGRSLEAFELISLARDKVRERFGLELELEVVTLSGSRGGAGNALTATRSRDWNSDARPGGSQSGPGSGEDVP